MVTDVSGQPVDPIFQSKAVQNCLTLNMISIGSLEISVTNYP